jgi:hypothetical protein
VNYPVNTYDITVTTDMNIPFRNCPIIIKMTIFVYIPAVIREVPTTTHTPATRKEYLPPFESLRETNVNMLTMHPMYKDA